MKSFPTVSEIERITALADPVLRNLQITQCYAELSAALPERTGLLANWCTFATWASKQAGRTIRKEDLARLLEAAVRSDPAVRQAAQGVAFSAQQVGLAQGAARGAAQGAAEFQALVWEAWDPTRAFDRAAEAVAVGNQKVFAEIGREFARFYAELLADAAYDEARIERFCRELFPGDPPEGQRYLRQAFRRIYQAFFVEDSKVRVELLLLANLEIGLHEQTRLQPEILEALDAPMVEQEEFVRRLWQALLRRRGIIALARWLVLRLFGRLDGLERAIRVFLEAARRQARRILTEALMTLHLPPHLRLRLGDDLRAAYPDSLREIVNPDLCALLAQIDPTPNSTRDSGALDWGDLPERMHFITDMFRCYQESADLFSPPFTPGQVEALKAGRLPEGRL
jgi:hypothetical protein